MESLALASSPRFVLGYSFQNPRNFRHRQPSYGIPLGWEQNRSALSKPRWTASATARPEAPRNAPNFKPFARLSSSSQETSSIAGNPQIPLPPPSSHVGSPLFWIGVGVGMSALFSFVVKNLKKYAMQQAFKTLMGQMNSQSSQFNNAGFSPESPFPFPTPSASGPATRTSSIGPQPVTVDVSAAKVDAVPASNIEDGMVQNTETKKEPRKNAFVDVSPDETSLRAPFEIIEDQSEMSSSKNDQFSNGFTQNGAAFKQATGASAGFQSTSTDNAGSVLSVEALEKMMEDPTVQKMVYPYLPEEMRNPATFKWMLQNPEYRQQLEGMLNSMSGTGEWDSRMMDTLKDFNLSSPEVKQQFDQIGLTPEEVISKIMANPDVALAFQNPRVQAAIMDCSQNPLSIGKYQNDKEVMDVFNKISELFPGVTGS